jgi:hypothetical protein
MGRKHIREVRVSLNLWGAFCCTAPWDSSSGLRDRCPRLPVERHPQVLPRLESLLGSRPTKTDLPPSEGRDLSAPQTLPPAFLLIL